MEDSYNKSSSESFLKTERGKTKSNAIEIPSISLPKGGGAIKGIDEKFSVNAVNGTAGFSIPLPFSQSRGISPSLSLSYSSGAGNGVFGLGWNLGLSSIKRKTDKQLPQYRDEIDSDTYLFSETEDLVAEFKKASDGSFIKENDDYVINERNSADGKYIIRHYRPRIEGLFARIERWISKDGKETKWRIITQDNITTLYGWTPNSILTNPHDNTKTFEWLPEFVFDDKGNCARYIYKHEDAIGIDTSQMHNNNRIVNNEISYSNCYLHKVLYGNNTPYGQFGDSFPKESDFLFETAFDYGTLKPEDNTAIINNWDFRKDAFSDYKAGFEIRTTRLCKRVLLFHHFTGENEYDGLVSSINFEYDTHVEEDFTFLKKVTSHGYIKKPDGTYSEKNLPPMEFSYQAHDWNKEIKAIASESIVNAPSGLAEQQYQFTDLYNEGLNGILTEQGNGWYYKHNLGNGKFEQAKLVTPKPSFAGLGSVLQLADLDADGGKQLVSYSNEPTGYFELDDDNEWQNFRSFKALPNIDFGDPNTRMLDLNGDGKAELVITEDNVFTWYPSNGKEGYLPAHKTLKPFDEEKGPAIAFADQNETIFLADMSGSGMTDIVRIRNGEICYWPNLGYGKFGSKVAMDNAPVFDHPDAFNPSYLKLADIDGSGTTDIIYLGKNNFTCWKNLNGNRFTTQPFEIDVFPEIHSHAKITVTDLLGNGVACIVWSSPLLKDANTPLKYIDLMNSKKPHIMVSYKNNLGKEVSMEYTPSTKFYIEDKQAGKPWVTKLHFPVHCISRTITEDKISGYKFVSEYKYHHGYYDHAEREFRGFGMVEQIDSESFEHWSKGSQSNIVEESLHQEPVVTKSWYHTGAFLQKDKILNQFEKDYWYNEMLRMGYPITHYEVPLQDAQVMVAPGINPSLLNHLSTQEWQEAMRACKGMPLRAEVFAFDASKFGNTEEAQIKELTPYSVATHNCVIEILQPKGSNKHAVFIVKESEAITYNYERNPEDPRVAHNLNIKLDEYGNVLESASVVYPRIQVDSSLPPDTQGEQNKTVIIYNQNLFTNDVFDENTHYLRLPSEVKTYELKKVEKPGFFYSLPDFENILSDSKSDIRPYHQMEEVVQSEKAQKRLIEHIRTTYYRNDLTDALPLHQLESPAIPYESYQLAYTPELLSDIFNNKVTAELLTEGKFTNSENDESWWIRSGTTHFIEEGIEDAKSRFYAPRYYKDPYGAITKVEYYGNYFLFIEETEDALGNKSSVENFNFRTMTPNRMKDINGNLSETISDELGLVKAVALLGKGNEADHLEGLSEITTTTELELIKNFFQASDSTQLTNFGKELLSQATSRFVYDFENYRESNQPAVIASIAREEHFQKSANAPVQLGFEYSNGSGEVIMKKMQAEPGKAKQVIVEADDRIRIEEEDTSPDQLRWLGNGRTIKNNKGNEVKQYEPYFSVNWEYENYKELVETGVTPLMYYDAAGRLIKTEMPDGTFSKTELHSWKQVVYDQNDTVLESTWYKNRKNRLTDELLTKEGKDPKHEEQAAIKAAKHYDTPSVVHLDTLGRPVLSIAHNRIEEKDANGNVVDIKDEFYNTLIHLDIEGNARKVQDARGNTVMSYKYDMLGHAIYQKSMDAGQRWLLTNCLGNPLRTWDERNHEFQYFYDTLQRPTHSKVKGGDGESPLNHIFSKIIYGESRLSSDRSNEGDLQSQNILGKPIQTYDTGGLIETLAYDFKGQPKATTRRLFKKYKEVTNWMDANLETDLEADEFTFETETDALGRIIRQTAPDNSVITPSYNAAGLLNGETVLHPQAEAAVEYIKNIEYNEKGQREKIIYGNNVSTKFYYDKETFRLNRLESRKKEGDLLQDLLYTYDPVGNITFIEDKAIPIGFFNNTVIEPISEYTYDALYRLVKATGRENNDALSFDSKDNWNDAAFMHNVNPGDPMAVRNYTQKYHYDSVGNILQMKHSANGNNWSRDYQYENQNNRLVKTQVGSQSYLYPHHSQHGYITAMPHLEEMGWNFKEELVKTIRQKRSDGGTAETTYYQYDGSGQRIRKITENQSQAGAEPTKKEERIYVSGYELYKKHSGTDAGLERVSLSLMEEDHRFVMIETRNAVDDGTEKQLVRYQLHNHLGSAALELDNHAKVISYEEYHPFGTTSYQATNARIKSAAKRYRYTGMERDEETGLEYHSARYYLPWLGRWLSADPIGIGDGVNVYRYCKNNPMKNTDLYGKQTGQPLFNSEYEAQVGLSLSLGTDTAEVGIFAQSSAALEFSKLGGDIGLRAEFNIAHLKHGSWGAAAEFSAAIYGGIGYSINPNLINSGRMNTAHNIRDFTASGISMSNVGLYYGQNLWEGKIETEDSNKSTRLFSRAGSFGLAFGGEGWRFRVITVNDLFWGNELDAYETASAIAELSLGDFSFGLGFFNITDQIEHGSPEQVPEGYKIVEDPKGTRLIDLEISSSRISSEGEIIGQYSTEESIGSLHSIYGFVGGKLENFDYLAKGGLKGSIGYSLTQGAAHLLLDLHDLPHEIDNKFFFEFDLNYLE